jgi:hypothetical protein
MCSKGFTCYHFSQGRCKFNHISDDQQVGKQYQGMSGKFKQNDGQLACQAVDGNLRVVGFEMVPVMTEQGIEFDHTKFYLVTELRNYDA